MDSTFHNNNSSNSYISDDFLAEMSQAQLAELSVWETTQFDNFDNNPADLSKFEISSDLDANFDFEGPEISALLSPPNMLVQNDFIPYPIYTYPTTNSIMPTTAPTTQLRSITINPSSNSSTVATAITTPTNFPPIFSASTATVAIPRNLIGNGSKGSNGSKKISTSQKISLPKSLQASSNISTTQSNTKLTNNDLESIKPDNTAKFAAEEDKRRRNTAASARFRVKKKLREQALERTAREMTSKVELLEGKVKELELQNKWLRSLIVEKDAKLLDVEPADKKQKLGVVIVPDDKNKNNKMVAIEQDYKKLKDKS